MTTTDRETASATTAGFAPNSATLESVNAPRDSHGYLALWRGVPRELGFLLLGLPIGVAGFAASTALFSAGVGTLVTFFLGVFLLIGMLYLARGFGTLELIRLDWARMPAIERPRWHSEKGFWNWLRSVLGNGHYWLYALHTMIVGYVVSLITWVITVTWLAIALGGSTYWIWGRYLPVSDNPWFLSRWLFDTFGDGDGAGGLDFDTLDSILQLALGLLFLATLPFITRGLTLVHYGVARVMLARFRSDDLQARVVDLSASRTAAVSAEGTALRRLERDIHDGPQQRLVRLQMDLAAAGRQLDTDPDAARNLIDGAMAQSREALEELRALSRGFAPPILLDRGLVAALESLTVRSPIPVRFVNELASEISLPQEIERNAYFVATELLTNATKHSGASGVELRLALRRIPGPDDTWLDLSVTDDGTGGAQTLPGHGLAGLDERMRGLGGMLQVHSPAGGPTTVTAHLPVTY
ncbi:sensor histidine kinase [Parafrigoribacterium mesophilum]|uniref:sensor histidine kinase n=1 Tax=Parafrigoribacterium mesophilum TaxID=433646 RepID=UPI0031FC107A